MVFSLLNLCHYLLANPFTFYTDHQALKYLVNRPLHHGRIYRWLLLFQEFEFEVVVWPGKANAKPDHLSRAKSGEDLIGIDDDLLDTHLFRLEAIPIELSEISQYLQERKAPIHYSKKRKKILTIKDTSFTLINWSLYKLGLDDVLLQCALEHERHDIIQEAHAGSVGGHFSIDITIKKILQSSLWWPTIKKDCKNKIDQCDAYQRIGQPLQEKEMPLLPLSPSLTFETWDINFIGSFPKQGKRIGARYIIIVVIYVIKWEEEKPV